MKKNLFLASLLCLASFSANAEFQVEMRGNLSLGERDDQDINSTLGAMSIYFEAVDTSNGALREAAFLNKSSNVTITGFSDKPNQNNGIDSFNAAASIRYVTSESNRIIELTGGRGSTDGINDRGFFGLGLGTYISDNAEVVASFEKFSSGGRFGVDLHAYHDVNPDTGSGFAYDLFFGSIDRPGLDNSSVSYGAGWTYYLNKQLGFSLDLGFESFSKDREVVSYGLGVDYFINEFISLTAAFTSSNDEIFDDSLDTFIISGSVRF